MNIACGACIYYGDDSACRRHAPTLVSGTLWPVVDPITDWCAEGYNETDGFYDRAPALPSELYARTMKAAP